MSAASYKARGRTGLIEDGRKRQLVLAGAALLFVVIGFVLIGSAIPGAKGESKQARPITGTGEYAKTQAGAVTAATDFYIYFLLVDLDDPVTGRERLMASAAPEYQQQLAGELDQLFELQASNPLYKAKQNDQSHVAKAWPLTYRAEQFTGNTARVSIWASTLAGIEGEAPPRVGYAQAEVALRWIGESWMVTKMTESPAPVPYLSAQDDVSSDAEFYSRTKGMVFYDQAP